MFWARIDIRPCINQNEDIRFGRKHGCDTWSIDSWQRAKFNHACRDGRAGVPGTYDRICVTVFNQIDGTAYGGIFFPADSCPGAIAHIYNLRGMDDLDPRIVALMLAQLVLDPGGVPDKIKFTDLLVIAQRHNGAGNKVRRAKVTAHRVEGDLHRCETLRTLAAKCNLFTLERQHLSPAVVTVGRASNVRGNGASTLGAFVQMRSMPAVGRFARAQSHLGCFAFWDSHGRGLRKHV